MITISLCMIVKDEEFTLPTCLDSVHDLVDEIIIVDTGSSDNTIRVAKRYTNKVHTFPWTGKFKDARNESFKYATKDYILYLDADDIIQEQDRKKFLLLKETLDPSIDSVSMYYFAGIDDYGNIALKFRRNRLVKRSRQFQWKGDVHNFLDVKGKILLSDIGITHIKKRHATARNLNIYQQKVENGDPFSTRDYFYYGNELRENGFPEKAIEAYTKCIDSPTGWNEDKAFACIFRADCYKETGKTSQQLTSLLQSFFFVDTPLPEACCRIGYFFQQNQEYDVAIWWYDVALTIPINEKRWGFTYMAYSTWYPHLHLCICYYNLQQFKEANMHNDIALRFRPQDALLLFHKHLLRNK